MICKLLSGAEQDAAVAYVPGKDKDWYKSAMSAMAKGMNTVDPQSQDYVIYRDAFDAARKAWTDAPKAVTVKEQIAADEARVFAAEKVAMDKQAAAAALARKVKTIALVGGLGLVGVVVLARRKG